MYALGEGKPVNLGLIIQHMLQFTSTSSKLIKKLPFPGIITSYLLNHGVPLLDSDEQIDIKPIGVPKLSGRKIQDLRSPDSLVPVDNEAIRDSCLQMLHKVSHDLTKALRVVTEITSLLGLISFAGSSP